LGKWISHQRAYKKNEGITEQRQKQLDDLDFIWDVDEFEWNKNFEALKAYKKEFGDCNVSNEFKNKDGSNLGRWVGYQRKIIKKLSPEKKKLLDDLGFDWVIRRRIWDDFYNCLKEYKTEFGDCNLSVRYKTKNGILLGRWAGNQRAYKNLSPERKKKLDDLGFVWDLGVRSWGDWLKDLIAYKKEFGDCNVPAKFKTSEKYALGTWVRNQRKGINLTPERKKKLDDLGFIWNLKLRSWDDWLKDLIAYKKEFGNCEVPTSFITREKYALGSWVHTQRKDIKLTPERKKKLDDLGFVWKIRRDWEDWYQELKEYKKEFGDCGVPARYKTNDGTALGTWVVNQRVSQESLPPERKKLLDDLGFVWDLKK
jgi:hypothetical protein